MIAELKSVVTVAGLSRRFGRKAALDGVNLDVPRGVVFGLVGENGAGKTTLIKHLLGLFKAQAGTVRVFGLDPVRDPVGVLARTGYLSEDRDLPEWMRLEELFLHHRSTRSLSRASARTLPRPWRPENDDFAGRRHHVECLVSSSNGLHRLGIGAGRTGDC
jgi:ABC-type multidrug transport system ATPase subunit